MVTAMSTATTRRCSRRHWAAPPAARPTAWRQISTAMARSNQADEVILASDYGFHATTATVPTTPPAQPVFNLDVNSQTPPGSGMTTDATVTLVGKTDPECDGHARADPEPPPRQTRTACSPSSAWRWPTARIPSPPSRPIRSDATSQYTEIITRSLPGLSLIAPVITAQLADDTGVSALDNITSDDTIIGNDHDREPNHVVRGPARSIECHQRAQLTFRHDLHDHSRRCWRRSTAVRSPMESTRSRWWPRIRMATCLSR